MRIRYGSCAKQSFDTCHMCSYRRGMEPSRTALVTGATQNLGRSLVAALAAGLRPSDRVLLTGRDPLRVKEIAAELDAASPGARVEGLVLDVTDRAAIDAMAAELEAVDIVFSNATTRMTPQDHPADEVDAVVNTSNVATTAVLRSFAPRMRPGGRLVIVASALGTLDKLPDAIAPRFAAAARGGLDAVDSLTEEWREAVRSGRAESEGFPRWLNIPSKVLQVAAVRAVAAERRSVDLAADRLIVALCPGLIDTAASRPWFEDMSSAQTPDEAAAWPVSLALNSPADHSYYGELVQFGSVLPWETGILVPHRAQQATSG